MDKETLIRYITLMGLDNEKNITDEMLDAQYEKLKTACIGEDEKLKEITDAYDALRENIDSANIVLGIWENSTAVKPVLPEKKGGRAWKIIACVCAVIVLCLAAVKLIGGSESAPAESEAPAAESGTAQGEQAAEINVPKLDYDKMYALHEPDEVVMTVGGEDITWGEYFSWVYMNASQVENYFAQMATYYNAALNWTDSYDENASYADYVVLTTESSIAQLIAIEKNASDKGFVKDAEFEKLLEETKAGDIKTVCGEGATEDEFFAKLAENYMSRACYERMSEANIVYNQAFASIYGEQFEKIPEEEILTFLSDNDYMYASHILLMTKDADGNELDDAAKAEKKQQLEEFKAELSAIEDKRELVDHFKALKQEHDEDTGKTAYPDGYLFTPGTMVSEFEDAVKGLEDYGISDIVETSYGYHLIIRLPLDTEAVMGYNNDGTTYTPRVAYASESYGNAIRDALYAADISYADGFEALDVTKFVKE